MRISANTVLAAMALLCGCGRTEPLVSRSSIHDQPDGSVGACALELAPDEVDFGDVPLGTQVSSTLTLRNVGEGLCDIARLAIGEGSDPQFALLYPPSTPFSMEAGEVKHLSVAFDAKSRELPRERLGTAVVLSTDVESLRVVQLHANILVGCDLQIAPAEVDFGSVRLNLSATASVTLTNLGTAPCEISGVSLAPGSDPLFSIPADQPKSFVLAPGSASLRASFSARDSTEPHERHGTLTFTRSQPAGLPKTPTAQLEVPLKAFIDTACLEGSQWIYTVDDIGRLATFDPEHLQYTDIGALSCPTSATPFSMAVDQNAVAWVEYMDGYIYRVDTKTAACTSTSFSPDPWVTNFGMGFVYDPDLGKDTLYVAGGETYGDMPSTLATISFPSLDLQSVAEVSFGAPELTGTGDGELWGFAPSFNSVSGVTTLARIDQTNGKVLSSMEYPEIFEGANSYALAFWGGSFWLFLGDTIYEVPRDTLESRVALSYSGRRIVGVGVSTCAPLD